MLLKLFTLDNARTMQNQILQWVRSNALLLLVLLLATSVRVVGFPSIPPGLNQDEASTAYDAYSLLHYGIDRTGNPFPMVLVSWGSGMNAIPAYLAMPFIALFGLNEGTARIVNVLLGIISVLLLYLIARKIEGKTTGLLAAFLLAISPWHIVSSRVGIDETALPFFFLAGVYFFVRSIERPRMLFVSFLLLGLALGTHGAAYFAVPVFAVLSTAYVLWHRSIPVRTIIGAWVMLVLLALPHLIFLVINQLDYPAITTPFFSIPRLQGEARYEQVSAIFGSHPLRGILQNFRIFLEYMRTQNDGLPWNNFSSYGFLYVLGIPLALLGVLRTWSEREQRAFSARWFVIIWLLTAVLMAGMMAVNTNRINLLFIPLIYFAALGISFFRKYPIVFFLIVLLYSFSFAGFTRTYFTTYPEFAGANGFYASITDAIRFAVQEQPTGTVCVTENVNQAYIYVLFATQMNPWTYLQTRTTNTPSAPASSIASMDRYVFGLQRCRGLQIVAYVLQEGEISPFQNSSFAITRFGHYATAVPIVTDAIGD